MAAEAHSGRSDPGRSNAVHDAGKEPTFGASQSAGQSEQNSTTEREPVADKGKLNVDLTGQTAES